jgi:transcriptional regulator GlxA family with amidase domain
MEQIQILLFDGVDELDVVAPYEVLAAAGLTVELVSLDDSPIIRTAHGITLNGPGPLAAKPDLLIVPGGGWLSRAPMGAWAEAQRGVMPAAISGRHRVGAVVAGVCSGVMIMAASGMLSGRPAVTHHGSLEELRRYGANVRPEARVVDDGDVITAGGVTSAIDLALHIVRRELGEDAARAGAERIEYEPRGPALKAAGKDPGAAGVHGL